METEINVSQETAAPEDIRVVHSTTCQSLSGKSTLGLDWGCDQESQIHLRLCSNSGRGLFNRGWLALSSFFTPAGEPITGSDYKAIFVYRSANDPSFFKAGLQSQNLLSAQGYTEFLAKAQGWMAGAVPQEGSATLATRKKPTLKKEAS